MNGAHPASHPLVLVTGATGYIGGRLVPRLAERGLTVRCMARNPSHVRHHGANIEVVRGDVTDPASLPSALTGVVTAFYLIHAMGETSGFEEAEAEGARNFALAARQAGVQHIIYLGGLGDASVPLSAHLRSRHEVGHILRQSGVVTTEFRASIIIGSGSLSFEMIRALVERLPFMITPKWVGTMAQPIAINDVLDYLLEAAGKMPDESRIYEIGGQDCMSYRALMMTYAAERGLTRRMLSVPVLSPRLSSLWLGLVTPLYARVGRKLVDSLRFPTVCRDHAALKHFSVKPMDCQQAIRDALRNEDRTFAETRWSDAMSSAGGSPTRAGLRFGNRLVDTRRIRVPVPPAQAFAPVRRIGGTTGWYYGNGLWKLRGWIDVLVGGPGMKRGRPDPEQLRRGDTLDCWRVEEIEEPCRLRLIAEMKLPGRAWLEYHVEPDADGSVITQTASFDPLGLSGILYWYAVFPLHELIFNGMLKEIARRSDPHRP